MPTIKTGRKHVRTDCDYYHKLNDEDRAWYDKFQRGENQRYKTDSLLTEEQLREVNHTNYVERTGQEVLTFTGVLPDVAAYTMESMDPAVLCELKQEADLISKKRFQEKRRLDAARKTKQRKSR